MFGYIKPLECELKVKDKALYDAAYCGLCRTLGKEFGQTARAVLSFDCTFIAMLAASASDMPKIDSRRCAYKPFRKSGLAQLSARRSNLLRRQTLYLRDINCSTTKTTRKGCCRRSERPS